MPEFGAGAGDGGKIDDAAAGGTTDAAAAGGEFLCAAADLAERGRAVVWDVLERGQPARAFALRVDGGVVAYLNRCVHVPSEMDWQPGEFLDADRRWIVCSMHGAAYDPADGRCVGGPCGRGRLQPVRVREEAGRVCWYPSEAIRPVVFDAVESTGTQGAATRTAARDAAPPPSDPS